MALTNQTLNPFGSQFRKEFYETAEAGSRFLKIERQLKILIARPEQVFDEGGVGTDVFPIIVGVATGEGFPKQYVWAEAQLVGPSTYQVLPDGRSSDDEELGLGINRVELITGFGVDFGPYGQPLTGDPNVIITVLEVASGSPTHMMLETNDSGVTVPVFEAYNPFRVECVV